MAETFWLFTNPLFSFSRQTVLLHPSAYLVIRGRVAMALNFSQWDVSRSEGYHFQDLSLNNSLAMALLQSNLGSHMLNPALRLSPWICERQHGAVSPLIFAPLLVDFIEGERIYLR